MEPSWKAFHNGSVAPKHSTNWLRVLATAELPHLDYGVGHQFHAKLSWLNRFTTQEELPDLIFPCNGPIILRPQRLQGSIAQTLSPALHGLSIARLRCDVREPASLEEAVPAHFVSNRELTHVPVVLAHAVGVVRGPLGRAGGRTGQQSSLPCQEGSDNMGLRTISNRSEYSTGTFKGIRSSTPQYTEAVGQRGMPRV
jgi:hypothetical protein